MQFAEAMEINDFKESQGCLGKVLKQYGWDYLNLHGEADEISDEEFNNIFQQWTEKILGEISRYERLGKIESTMPIKQDYSIISCQAVIL